MKKNRLYWFFAVVVSVCLPSMLFAQPADKYVGVDKCKLCHKSESRGNQYGNWQNSLHSKAYGILANSKAKWLAEAAGIIDDPQKSEKCLKCHTTAFGVTADMIEEGSSLRMEDGIQCETCHGPGAKYWSIDTMKDKTKAIANGLNAYVKEEICVKCHNSESPTCPGQFDFEKMREKISHLNPKNK